MKNKEIGMGVIYNHSHFVVHWTGVKRKGWRYQVERYYISRRRGDETLSADKGNQQTDYAGL